MNFTQQTGFVQVVMPRVVLQWKWWGSGHYDPTAASVATPSVSM